MTDSSREHPSRAETLADAAGYRITFHPAQNESSVLLITFGTMLSGLQSEGFGTNFAKKMAYDHIYVAQASDSWYQQLSREEFVAAVGRTVEGYERVVAYGSSLGGYAALYFGSTVRAQIVAGAPINWAHPLMEADEWRHVTFTHDDFSLLAPPALAPVVLYDPMRTSDRLFIETLITPAMDTRRFVHLPFTGHAVFVALRVHGLLNEFLVEIIERDTVINIDLKKEGSYIYHVNYGEYLLANKDVAGAELNFQRSLECEFNKPAARQLSKLLSSQKRFGELEELAERGLIRLGSSDFLKGIKMP